MFILNFKHTTNMYLGSFQS